MFINLARSISTAKGVPRLPIVVIPHPLGGLPPEEVKVKADNAIERIITLLTTPRDVLMKETQK